MVVLVFDLDDTLLMSKSYNQYSDINEHTKLNKYLDNLKCKKFIYTNGIYIIFLSSNLIKTKRQKSETFIPKLEALLCILRFSSALTLKDISKFLFIMLQYGF